jgi:U3 small nucleolar RNA-associated protein 20
MTVEMDMAYLSDVIRQLAVTLKEGYQLHVRMATLHTILQELAKNYHPPLLKSSDNLSVVPFDNCIPAMMDLIQQDLFGTARERKEAEGAMKRLVKEATGSKSTDAIELICRILSFAPSSVARSSSGDAVSVSAIHAVVAPLLERLRTPDITARAVGRIGECLTRVVVGLSHNETATSGEILPFVYSSIAPFVGRYQSALLGGDGSNEDSSDDEDCGTDIRVSQTGADASARSVASKQVRQKKVKSANVVEWRPSTLNAASNAVDARNRKTQERCDLRRVQDGASAPKLTGSGRFGTNNQPLPSAQGLSDPASISGVTFGLSLLYSSLKKGNFDVEDGVCRSMLDPFIPMLTTCVCECRNNDVILLSLRCLGVLLRLKLPSVQNFSTTLGAKTLDILTSSGNLSNLNQELTQACFKTLTLVINLDAVQADKPTTGLENGSSMPLDADQMQVLISLLKAAVVESDHHHPTLALIKAIVSRQFVSSEFYDLMDTMLDISVKSHKATLRQVRGNIIQGTCSACLNLTHQSLVACHVTHS